MTGTTIGSRLAGARVARRLTLDQVTAETQISRPTLWRYESDRSSPSAILLVKLCRLYDVRPEYILFGEGAP